MTDNIPYIAIDEDWDEEGQPFLRATMVYADLDALLEECDYTSDDLMESNEFQEKWRRIALEHDMVFVSYSIDTMDDPNIYDQFIEDEV